MLHKILRLFSRRVFIVIIVICFSALVWVLWHREVRSPDAYNTLVKQYPFLSKRVLNDNENDLLIHFIPLRKQLREKVAPYGDTFAFYFEYLPTGVSIGINEKVDYESASLLKLPLVITYFMGVENSGLDINQDVTIQKNQIDDGYGELWKSGPGTRLSIDSLISYALVKSDNTAAKVLADQVKASDYIDVYNGLDIEVPEPNNPVKLAAKSYSSIFKALYFSSLINREHSQKILDLLTRTDFHDELPAGVPTSVPVAHKVGITYDTLYQDCGIVYEPQRPYILCMISQSTEGVAKARMKEISAMVYQYIHSVK